VAALAAEAAGSDQALPPPQVEAIALAVADRDRAQRFYDQIGFATLAHRGEGVVVCPGNGLGLALLEQRDVLALVGPGSGGSRSCIPRPTASCSTIWSPGPPGSARPSCARPRWPAPSCGPASPIPTVTAGR
jgi:hypothetical protein